MDAEEGKRRRGAWGRTYIPCAEDYPLVPGTRGRGRDGGDGLGRCADQSVGVVVDLGKGRASLVGTTCSLSTQTDNAGVQGSPPPPPSLLTFMSRSSHIDSSSGCASQESRSTSRGMP